MKDEENCRKFTRKSLKLLLIETIFIYIENFMKKYNINYRLVKWRKYLENKKDFQISNMTFRYLINITYLKPFRRSYGHGKNLNSNTFTFKSQWWV